MTPLRVYLYAARRLLVCVFFLFLLAFLLSNGPSKPPLLWSRRDLQNCVSTACPQIFHIKSPLSQTKAAFAHASLRAYLSNPLHDSPAPLTSHSSCAIVGGAPLSAEHNIQVQSRLIDAAHVIRINIRLPSLQAADEVPISPGTRTHMVILQRGALRTFDRYIRAWGQGNRTLANRRRHAINLLRREAPVILYRSECPGRNGACGAAWMALRRAALPKWTALYFLHPNIELSTRQLLQHVDDGFEERHVASTGIVAVVFALRICKRISLFGFNGSVIGDREVRTNIVWRGHHLLAERHLIHWLETCHDGPFAHLCRRLKIYS